MGSEFAQKAPASGTALFGLAILGAAKLGEEGASRSPFQKKWVQRPD